MNKTNAKRAHTDAVSRLERLKTRVDSVASAMRKPALAKIFFLLVERPRYGKELAVEYYSAEKRNPRMKMKHPNQKVIAIYLNELLNAELIRKCKKEGRIQKYEIDWDGVLDIFMYINGLRLFDYSPIGDVIRNYAGQTNIKTTEGERAIYDFFTDSLVKPFFEARSQEIKDPEVRGRTRDESGKYQYRLMFENEVQLKTLSDELKRLLTAMTEFEQLYPELIEKYLTKSRNQSEIIFWYFKDTKEFNQLYKQKYDGTAEGTVIAKLAELTEDKVK